MLCMEGKSACSGKTNASSLPNRCQILLPPLEGKSDEGQRARSATLVSGYETNNAADVILLCALAFHLLRTHTHTNLLQCACLHVLVRTTFSRPITIDCSQRLVHGSEDA